ncbi:MAG: carboxymuconolactone decarboxylase family protein [Phycisphaerales bacterium]|nr:MAG: carboxymuconolactone decarboxylase family protein [Phycisphaerales bacterium]
MISHQLKERNALHQHFGSVMPNLADNFDDLIRLSFADGALSAQIKELIALGISVSVRCEPCMHYHIVKARQKGASDAELLEAMTVGFEMGAGVLKPPLGKALSAIFPTGDKRASHLRSMMPDLADNFDDLMQLTFAAGALPAQVKELIALAISVSLRCEPCMNYHAEQARQTGASDAELLETMTVGFEMGVGALIPPLRTILKACFPAGGDQA